ncbi:hypothetical protein HK104_009123 [Borealophlyctis nickersoniae]|nr:hypothetical protein HK104_009123 [Borealophlyctis nickersoniae]
MPTDGANPGAEAPIPRQERFQDAGLPPVPTNFSEAICHVWDLHNSEINKLRREFLNRLSHVQADREDLRSQLERTATAAKVTETELRMRADAAERRAFTAETRAEKLEKKLAEANAEKETLRQQISDPKNVPRETSVTVEALSSNISTLNRKIADLKTQHANELAEVNGRLVRQIEQYRTMTAHFDQAKAEVAEIRKKLELSNIKRHVKKSRQKENTEGIDRGQGAETTSTGPAASALVDVGGGDSSHAGKGERRRKSLDMDDESPNSKRLKRMHPQDVHPETAETVVQQSARIVEQPKQRVSPLMERPGSELASDPTNQPGSGSGPSLIAPHDISAKPPKPATADILRLRRDKTRPQYAAKESTPTRSQGDHEEPIKSSGRVNAPAAVVDLTTTLPEDAADPISDEENNPEISEQYEAALDEADPALAGAFKRAETLIVDPPGRGTAFRDPADAGPSVFLTVIPDDVDMLENGDDQSTVGHITPGTITPPKRRPLLADSSFLDSSPPPLPPPLAQSQLIPPTLSLDADAFQLSNGMKEGVVPESPFVQNSRNQFARGAVAPLDLTAATPHAGRTNRLSPRTFPSGKPNESGQDDDPTLVDDITDDIADVFPDEEPPNRENIANPARRSDSKGKAVGRCIEEFFPPRTPQRKTRGGTGTGSKSGGFPESDSGSSGGKPSSSKAPRSNSASRVQAADSSNLPRSSSAGRIAGPDGVPYKYQEVVRRKEDRKRMHGEDCPCCTGFYRAAGPVKPLKELGAPTPTDEDHIQVVSRHRYWAKNPETPPGFWQVDFPTTQEAREYNEQARASKKQGNSKTR